MIRRQLVAAVVLTAIVAVTLGLLYPLAMAGVGAVAFPFRSGGSLIKQNGQVVGSALIGQNFLDKDGNALPQYFQPRPSASGANGYDPVGATCTPQLVGCGASTASNLGPGDPKLVGNVPGPNIDTKTNPYATPADPWCVPVQQTDKNNNPVSDKQGNPVYQKDKDGNYMCNPNTVPERAIAYRQLNNLSDEMALVALYLAFILSQGVSRNLLRTANVFNSVGLVAVSGFFLWQSVERLLHPVSFLPPRAH